MSWLWRRAFDSCNVVHLNHFWIVGFVVVEVTACFKPITCFNTSYTKCLESMDKPKGDFRFHIKFHIYRWIYGISPAFPKYSCPFFDVSLHHHNPATVYYISNQELDVAAYKIVQSCLSFLTCQCERSSVDQKKCSCRLGQSSWAKLSLTIFFGVLLHSGAVLSCHLVPLGRLFRWHLQSKWWSAGASHILSRHSSSITVGDLSILISNIWQPYRE